MAGNVAEWTNDWYQANYYSQPDAAGPNPRGPAVGETKVVRGGSWSTQPIFARAVHRVDVWEPGATSTWVGFRCAANAGPFTSTSSGTTGTSGGVSPAVIPTFTPPSAPGGAPTATLSASQ
jgi:hypothetical protein